MRLQLGGRDHLLPLGVLGLHLLDERRGIARQLGGAGIADLLDHRLGPDALGDLVRQLLDDVGRRAGRGGDVPPGCCVKSGIALLGHGRHLGRREPAFGRADGQCAQGAGLDVLQVGRQVVHGGEDVARQKVLHDQRAAAIDHVLEPDAGQLRQIFHGEVSGAADRGRAVAHLVGALGLAVVDELLERLGGEAGMDGQHVGHLADQRHRRKARDAVVGHGLVEILVGDGGADRAQQQRVAVGRRLGHQLGADIAAGTGLVVDDHLLAPRLGEVLRHDAAQQVGRSGRRERHHHADLLVGIGRLRPAMARQQRCNKRAGHRSATAHHLGHGIAPCLWATISSALGETNVTAPLTGYADRISVRAGEKIAFKVSSAGPGPYHAMLVRIIRGDPDPRACRPSSKTSRNCSTAASPRASSMPGPAPMRWSTAPGT